MRIQVSQHPRRVFRRPCQGSFPCPPTQGSCGRPGYIPRPVGAVEFRFAPIPSTQSFYSKVNLKCSNIRPDVWRSILHWMEVVFARCVRNKRRSNELPNKMNCRMTRIRESPSKMICRKNRTLESRMPPNGTSEVIAWFLLRSTSSIHAHYRPIFKILTVSHGLGYNLRAIWMVMNVIFVGFTRKAKDIPSVGVIGLHSSSLASSYY